MSDKIEQHDRISQSRVGGVHKVSKVVIEFLDGSTEVILTDEGPIYYKELFNDNNAKKASDHSSWKEHNLWWQSEHLPKRS